MKKILVVEDEEAIGILICRTLIEEGYLCDWARSGTEAAERIEKASYSLALLDIMLPGIDGYELVTAKGQLKDKVQGLKLGADDYIVKPFQISELVARVEAVLRRSSRGTALTQIGDVLIDLPGRRVLKGGKPVELTGKEFEILAELVSHKNMALSRAQIYEDVWNEIYTGETRTLDCHVQKLRKKLGWEDRIRTVFRVGYRLEV